MSSVFLIYIYSDDSLNEVQIRTQEIVSELKTAEGAMMMAPAILFSLFAGPYSDRRGRKLLLAAPFLGNILSYLCMLAHLVWWHQLRSAALHCYECRRLQVHVSTVRAEYLLVSGLAGLSGGYVCFNIGVYAYTADVSR